MAADEYRPLIDYNISDEEYVRMQEEDDRYDEWLMYAEMEEAYYQMKADGKFVDMSMSEEAPF